MAEATMNLNRRDFVRAASGLLVPIAVAREAQAWPRRGQSSAAPGQILDLTTPTATGTSFTAEFSVPSGNITGYQYRIDGGAEQSLGGGPGTAITNQVTGLAVDVEVRAMNGGVPGPWSNVSVGDPGVNFNFDFDTAGSWATQPTNVSTTSGLKSWPDIGFASDTVRDNATQTVRNVVADWRRFVNSSATVSYFFGMGRIPSQFTAGSFIWISLPSTSGVMTNGPVLFSGSQLNLTYTQYRDLVALLPDADQRAAYADPGSFPWGSSELACSLFHKALIENTILTSHIWAMAANISYSIDWDPDETVCAGGHYKAYPMVWHELTQSTSRAIGACRMSNMLSYTAPGTLWTSGGNPYLSHDLGVTNLGLHETVGGNEPFDWKSSSVNVLTSAFVFSNATGNPRISGTPIVIPGGRTLSLRDPQDAQYLFALYPATALSRSLAGF